MQTEQSQVDGEQSQIDDQIQNDSQQKADDIKEIELDSQVEEVLGSHLDVSNDETKTEDKKQDEVSENKDDSKKEEALNGNEENADNQEAVNNQLDYDKPQKLDIRIAKLYAKNKLLSGDDGDLDINEVAKEIQKYPFHKKKEALHNLLQQNRVLSTGKDDGVVEYSDEDRDSIVDAEVNNRLAEMEGEIQEKEYLEDLNTTLKAHPELDSDSKVFNQTLHDAVEKLFLNGMKASEAYKLVTNSIALAQGKELTEEKNKAEIEKQKALSGSVSVSSDQVEDDGVMTWDKMAKLEREDPERYMRIIESGNLPTR